MGLKLDGLTNDCSVHFVKAFWSLTEQNAFLVQLSESWVADVIVLVQSAVKMMSQSIKIRQWLEVPSSELTVQGTGGEMQLKPPSVHIGYKPIPLLLLSNKWRGSQVRLSSM